MKAGTSTTASLTLIAFPPPSVTLTFNGGSVLDEKRVTFKLADGKLSFIVQKVQKVDAGQYVLTVENQFGKASGAINVVVLGKIPHHVGYGTMTTESNINRTHSEHSTK